CDGVCMWVIMVQLQLMFVFILMAGTSLVGLCFSSTLGIFYFFYLFNALGYVCGGPLPNQVLLSRWFNKSRGKAMGIAYLGIGLGGGAVPWISNILVHQFGWQAALRILGILIIALSFPMAFFVKELPGERQQESREAVSAPVSSAFKTIPF